MLQERIEPAWIDAFETLLRRCADHGVSWGQRRASSVARNRSAPPRRHCATSAMRQQLSPSRRVLSLNYWTAGACRTSPQCASKGRRCIASPTCRLKWPQRTRTLADTPVTPVTPPPGIPGADHNPGLGSRPRRRRAAGWGAAACPEPGPEICRRCARGGDGHFRAEAFRWRIRLRVQAPARHARDYAVPGRPRDYLDLRTSTLAARLGSNDALEAWTFDYLHKFEWITLWSPLARDAVAMLFVLGNATVAALGWLLLVRGWRRRAV